MDVKKVRSSKLFPYQINWIKDKSKYAICEKSRRTGLTWAESIASVSYALDTGFNVWFSSSDEKNSKEFILYVQETCRVINADLGYDYIDVESATSEVVYLPNGARISSLSSSPRSLRGKDGRIVLDEFALHDDQEEIYRAAQGCIIQRGCIRIISTHDGPATLFYRLVTDKDNEFSKHRVTLVDALDQGYAVKFARDFDHLLPDYKAMNTAFLDSVKKGAASEDAFKQEFMCEPLSLQSLIAADEYDALKFWDVPNQLDPAVTYRPLHVGIDVGRVHDLTVVWILEEYENPKSTGEWDRYDYKTVAVHAIKNEPIPVQWEMIAPMLSHPSVDTIAIDQGTVGRSLADLVKDAYPHTNMMTFTGPAKARMAERVKGMIQYKRVNLPKEDAIRADLLALRRKVGKTGNVIYDGETKDTHCDYFWSLALAFEAAFSGTGAEVV